METLVRTFLFSLGSMELERRVLGSLVGVVEGDQLVHVLGVEVGHLFSCWIRFVRHLDGGTDHHTHWMIHLRAKAKGKWTCEISSWQVHTGAGVPHSPAKIVQGKPVSLDKRRRSWRQKEIWMNDRLDTIR